MRDLITFIAGAGCAAAVVVTAAHFGKNPKFLTNKEPKDA